MIGITAAGGKLGRYVVHSLLQQVPASEIALLVRSPDKVDDLAARGVQVRPADYHRPETWTDALRGLDKLLLISSPDRADGVGQHRTVIQAATTTGIRLLAFTSLLHTGRSTLRLLADFEATERLIRDSGIPFAILRNAWYTENKTMLIPAALAQGVFPGAAAAGRFSTAARQDYAEAAAAVLVGAGHEGRAYELAGDRSFALPEFVAKVAELTGQPLTYRNIGEPAFAALLTKFGIPAQNAEELAQSEAGGDRDEHFESSQDLSRLIKRPTIPWEATVKAAVAALPTSQS